MRKSTFVILLISIFFLSLFGVFSWMGNRIQPLEKDAMIAGQGALAGVKKFFVNFRSAAELQKKNTILQEENRVLTQSIARLISESKENEELKKILKFTSNRKIKTVNARIYGYQATVPSRGFFDAGKNEGIMVGNAVLSSSGNLIGVISQVREGVSEIIYLSSPDLALQVVGGGSDEVVGVTEGGNHVEVRIGLIPKSIPLKNGDVIFSAIEGTVPEEFLIGTIESVSSRPSDLFQSAIVSFVEPFTEVVRGSVVLGQN